MFQAGSVGLSYWMLFSQYWYWEDDGTFGNVMGLWGSADEDYNCRPVFYAYSLLTRFVRKGAEIYPLASADGHIVAVAFKQGKNGWSYLVVNDSAESKKISFLNRASYPKEMTKYVYDQNDVPEDNKVIAASGKVSANGRVLTDECKPMSLTVYTTL
jgi:alpha-galactosidase